jgi:hypothetical protein
MLIKTAAVVIILLGAKLAGLSVSAGASQFFPADSSVREMAPLPVLRTQGWLWDFFSGGRSEPPSSRMIEDGERKTDNGRMRASTGRYRTLCVRLCDGFYWPITHSTIRARFSRDAKQCESGCPGRSQLFVQRSGSDDIEGMVDLKGIPYTQLKNALRYRTEYVQDCTCRGNPWDPEAIARHRAYAEAAKSAPESLDADKRQSRNAKTNSRFGSWARADLEARD